MTIFDAIAVILSLVALGGYLNAKFIGLPATIGHMAFALILSVFGIAAGKMGWLDINAIKAFMGGIDFSQIFLRGMLAFLLFAGSLHIDLKELRKAAWPVALLATAGVLLATFITGSLTWLAARSLGIGLPYIYALLFGALISPTDPIAVLSILRQVGVAKEFYVKIGGESLFNDGIGVVVFLALLGALIYPGEMHTVDFLTLFARQSLGGIALGLALGLASCRLIRTIDDYKVEAMITLALVTGGYALAQWLDVSGPLCMVVAGLLVGNIGRNTAMSATTRRHLDSFWELIDEILNAVLFFVIGLEIMIVPLSPVTFLLGILAIATVLAGRLISVFIPITLLRFTRNFERGTIRLLVWGGLRGGLSIAMALTLPAGPQKSVILTLTYLVVLFSVLIQGLTFKRFVQFIMGQQTLSPKSLP